MLYDNHVWKFKVYREKLGTNVIDSWLDGLPPSAKASIMVKLIYLASLPEWKKGVDYKKLQGMQKIFEIRITDKIGKVNYRIFGCFGPGRKNFTLLVGATHKTPIYNPPNCIKTAQRRHKQLLKNKESVDDFQW